MTELEVRPLIIELGVAHTASNKEVKRSKNATKPGNDLSLGEENMTRPSRFEGLRDHFEALGYQGINTRN